MQWRMNLTRKDTANPEVHSRRDEMLKERAVTLTDLYGDPVISEHLRRYAAGVEESLDRMAKKAGLKPSENMQTAYGINGGATGAIEFWAQRSY